MHKALSIKYGKLLGLFTAIIFAYVLMLAVAAPVALAQELKRTITVVYPALVHTLNPGDRTEGITRIINQSEVPLTFKVSIQDYVVLDTIGTPTFLPPKALGNKYSAAAWISIVPEAFTLQPGDKQTINYYIQVPQDARPGGHYAAIVYTPVVDKNVAGSGSTVNAQLGSLFYITVNGPITEKSSVSKFFANFFQEYGPVDVLTQLKNLGDLHLAPKGTVTVTGLFFNQTQSLPTHNIFPEAARDFSNTFGQTLMVGRYKATLMASYGVSNNLPLVATVYFWVFPWRIILVIIFAAIALILSALYLKKRRKDGSKKPTEAKEEVVVPSTETPEVK